MPLPWPWVRFSADGERRIACDFGTERLGVRFHEVRKRQWRVKNGETTTARVCHQKMMPS
jgi:hypothetical protein